MGSILLCKCRNRASPRIEVSGQERKMVDGWNGMWIAVARIAELSILFEFVSAVRLHMSRVDGTICCEVQLAVPATQRFAARNHFEGKGLRVAGTGRVDTAVFAYRSARKRCF